MNLKPSTRRSLRNNKCPTPVRTGSPDYAISTAIQINEENPSFFPSPPSNFMMCKCYSSLIIVSVIKFEFLPLIITLTFQLWLIHAMEAVYLRTTLTLSILAIPALSAVELHLVIQTLVQVEDHNANSLVPKCTSGPSTKPPPM